MSIKNPFVDQFGKPLAVGDHFVKTMIDDGAPMWAHGGIVVGFGRKLVRVRYNAWAYDQEFPYHATAGKNLCKIPTTTTTQKGKS